jgi:hypothetical protein
VSEIVFILGAGASKEAGAPVIADFLDKAEELLRGGKSGEYKEDFERVFDARSKLQAVHSKAQLDLDNIESIFATFEIGRLVNRLPNIESAEINPLLVSIRRLIIKTLEQTVSYPVVEGRQVFPPDSYHQFAGLIKDLTMKGHACSIITFNYDYALDYAMNFNGIAPDYCLPETRKRGVIPLIKLHGSLNWARCPKCGAIIPWHIKDYMVKINPVFLAKETTDVRLSIGAQLHKSGIRHCEADVEPAPVIVPPTWNKTEYHQALSEVWGRAASELSTATNIFVSGYALSETDLFFRYLFALGTVGQPLIKRFWVFDPDSGVNERFRNLIGPGSITRYKWMPTVFGAMFRHIREPFKT